MHFTFISLFPEIFESILQSSILGRSLKKNVFSYSCIQIRDFAIDAYGHVDDTPYGGGPGMVLRADVLERALQTAFKARGLSLDTYDRTQNMVAVMSASGKIFEQKMAQKYAEYQNIFIVCGHYEGIDQRFIEKYADIEISIGRYVLTGGELPALVIADSIIRLLPGSLGHEESASEESFSFSDAEGELPEYPQYTRPEQFGDQRVPEILLSGNHQKIKEWRLEKAREKRRTS